MFKALKKTSATMCQTTHGIDLSALVISDSFLPYKAGYLSHNSEAAKKMIPDKGTSEKLCVFNTAWLLF